jgi:hypothetical protein
MGHTKKIWALNLGAEYLIDEPIASGWFEVRIE